MIQDSRTDDVFDDDQLEIICQSIDDLRQKSRPRPERRRKKRTL